jgi:hypothetical protein
MANETEVRPTATPERDGVSERESIVLEISDLNLPATVAGIARRC